MVVRHDEIIPPAHDALEGNERTFLREPLQFLRAGLEFPDDRRLGVGRVNRAVLGDMKIAKAMFPAVVGHLHYADEFACRQAEGGEGGAARGRVELLGGEAVASAPLGVGGLALSTAIAAVVQIVIMTRIMHRRFGVIMDAPTRASFARTVVASAVMAAAAWLASIAFAGQNTWTWSVAATLVLAGVGIVTYVTAARMLKMPELGWAIRGKSPD